MRFEATIGQMKAIFMVDSGSTHNFLDNKLVAKLGLSVEHNRQMKITVADRRRLLTREQVRLSSDTQAAIPKELQLFLDEFLDLFKVPTGLPPSRSQDHRIPLKDDKAVEKIGTWRLCVDYRHLNQLTVKDKFPIHIIEELLDELGQTRVFSKLDLRSEYTNWTFQKLLSRYDGHYEFLLMPFGLINVSSTF
ncbi:reverse transcriptase [Gossypium australe]|uniref:Reverse transcriptase n=1 Tax=Gossypium australe TaxID=47621 RepID=A0A5B6VNS6_9ROSI|nr:reverse transcriptase [Gossypium australe]